MSNAFETLKLNPSATEEEIVQQAGKIRQRTTDEATQSKIRQAVQQLTSTEEKRRLESLLTYQEPRYDWDAIVRLMNAHRRPPAGEQVQSQEQCPPLDAKLLASLLREMWANELQSGELSFVPPRIEELPEELDRQTVEALWRALLYDPRS